MADAAPPPPDEPELTLTSLPHAVALHIVSLLPADARACAACVCRGWGVVLSERSLWTRLNLSPASGVRVRVTDAVLAGAAAKARGQLAALNVSGCNEVSFDALLAVLRANAGALRELCVGGSTYHTPQTLNADRVGRALLAAPQLLACYAVVLSPGVAAADARRMLRNEPPFQPLRVRALVVDFRAVADEAVVLEVMTDIGAHASLKRVQLFRAPMHMLAALDAVVDAALARQLVSLTLWHCRLSPASTPALVRLLSGGTLTELNIVQAEQLLDGPSAVLLSNALRANSTLTSLHVCANLWRDGSDAAAALMSALTGHSSLRTLKLPDNRVLEAVRPDAGAALGALIAANAPALTELDVSECSIGDVGLGPLFDALPHNAHLRTLDVSDNDMSVAFALVLLLPARKHELAQAGHIPPSISARARLHE
jgi:hypothetical protein